ncbi:nitric oxide synthase oxygenase [Nocardia tengchongensis]
MTTSTRGTEARTGVPERERQCEDFFALPELAHLSPTRSNDAGRELRRDGTYRHTPEELDIGTKLAWRNHDRCVGRKHWRTLKVLDARAATSAADIAHACWEHLHYATNGGAVRSAITIAPPADAEGRAFRIINPQLICYAGYRVPGGVLGDPANVETTTLAMDLGWRGAGGPFDILPLLILSPDDVVHVFPIPPELVLEVPLTHPELSWFADLGLRWRAVPAVSNMDLEIGGITYPCAPFNGWYVSSEIGRDLGDSDRYDTLPEIAVHMGLDRSSERTLWRDRALIELSHAILHSYRRARVHLVDHHTVARQFIDHVDRENAAGRSCPADWTWINPPLSASLTPTFHRYFDPPDPAIRPAFVRRAPLTISAPTPTTTHDIESGENAASPPRPEHKRPWWTSIFESLRG